MGLKVGRRFLYVAVDGLEPAVVSVPISLATVATESLPDLTVSTIAWATEGLATTLDLELDTFIRTFLSS